MSFPKAPFQSAIQGASNLVSVVWQQWPDRAQSVLNAITSSGVTSGRPTTDLYTGQPYFDTDENQLYVWNGSVWMPIGAISGPTTDRPASGEYVGELYFDTTQNQLFAWNGSIWIAVGITSGTTANRPATDLYNGRLYFDTTQNQLFAWNGSIWIAVGITSGTTANRPATDLYDGRLYFDTTRGEVFFYTGSSWRSTRAGYYGTFYDNTDQYAANTTTAYAVTFNTPNGAWNVNLSNSSRINFPYSGIYNIQFSIQFINTDNNSNNPAEVNVWFRKNGSDIAESNSQFTIPTSHGGHDGALIAALNFIVDCNDNDYIQLMWQTENTSISIQTLPAGTTPTIPVTPSVILTAVQV